MVLFKSDGSKERLKEAFVNFILLSVILDKIISLLSSESSKLLLNYSDGFYASAAHGDDSGVQVFTLVVLVCTLIAGGILLAAYAFIAPRRDGNGPLLVVGAGKSKLQFYAAIGVLVVSIFLIVSFLVNSVTSTALISNFNQRLTILAPKISDQNYKEIRANWAMMKNKKDYKNIVDDMNREAKVGGVFLSMPCPLYWADNWNCR